MDLNGIFLNYKYCNTERIRMLKKITRVKRNKLIYHCIHNTMILKKRETKIEKHKNH
jgi:hypothetical protein